LARWIYGAWQADGRWREGSKANTSERLILLVAAGLLTVAGDPIRRPGGIRHFYAVTPQA
jgi:hypothetical protein